MDRSCFVFSDSLQAGGNLAVSHGGGYISKAAYTASAAHLAEIIRTQLFAGIVCVAD